MAVFFGRIKVCTCNARTQNYKILANNYKKYLKYCSLFLIFIRREYLFESLDVFCLATVLVTSGITCNTPKTLLFFIHVYLLLENFSLNCIIIYGWFSLKYQILFKNFFLYLICESKYFVQAFNLEIPRLIVTCLHI